MGEQPTADELRETAEQLLDKADELEAGNGEVPPERRVWFKITDSYDETYVPVEDAVFRYGAGDDPRSDFIGEYDRALTVYGDELRGLTGTAGAGDHAVDKEKVGWFNDTVEIEVVPHTEVPDE